MAGNSSFTQLGRLSRAKSREFIIVSEYKLGYRNREDITNLPAGVLIVGSKNVITNVSDRIQIRQGYALDGATSSIISSTGNSFDWITRGNGERHMRAGGLTSAGNDGHLQYRYVDTTNTVSWKDLVTGMTSVNLNYTTFWRTDESLRVLLFVDGGPYIREWNGAFANIASSDNTAGHIVTLNPTPTVGGSGYVLNDVLTITTGDGTATATVTGISGGAITTVILTSFGSGYSTGAGQATSGGTGTAATLNITAVATGRITIAGTTSVLDSGFYTTGNFNLLINGNSYAYTNMFGTSFLGISPSAVGEPVGSLIIQAVITKQNSSFTGPVPATFKNSLIKVLNNQIFLASTTASNIWISKVNSYTDYSESTPRQQGDGGTLILDDNIVAFEPQEQYMYVSAGRDYWYNVSFSLQTSTVGVTYEQVNALPLKTGKRQGAISQAFISHMKDNIIVTTNETTVDMFGRVETSALATPLTKNISDPIKLDIDSYDFTDGCIFYYRYYILVAVPKEGLVLMYNLATASWEAPQTIPVSRFYIVNGQLYGHSYNTFESYQLFTGYADRVYPGFTGYPIAANWIFSYQNYGTRFTYKKATSLYTEGYINANTILTASVNYELDGCMTTKNFTIDGSDTQIVCIPLDESSLGKTSLGKQKLGGGGSTSLTGLPPKFRSEKTFNNTNFFEVSISYSVLGINNRAELLAFGLNASGASEEPIMIRQ